MNQVFIKSIKMSLIGFLSLFLSHCSDSNFSGQTRKNATSQPAPAVSPTSATALPGAQEGEESFPLSAAQQSKVDIVWVIDNSGSMKEEAAQVRQNLEQFLRSVDAGTDLNFALISAYEPIGGVAVSTDVGLPAAYANNPRYRHINIEVGSNDPLALVASAVCRPSCTLPPITGLGTFNVAHIEGRLNGFFRPQSHAVFVVVTDDNARWVTDQNFLSLVKPSIPSVDIKVFGFVGLTPGSADFFPLAGTCDIAAEGTAYKNLARASGSEVFDICQADWSASFGKLTQAVIASAQSDFTIARPKVSQVTSVSLNDRELSPQEYAVTGQVVRLNANVIPPSGGTLKVKFLYMP